MTRIGARRPTREIINNNCEIWLSIPQIQCLLSDWLEQRQPQRKKERESSLLYSKVRFVLQMPKTSNQLPINLLSLHGRENVLMVNLIRRILASKTTHKMEVSLVFSPFFLLNQFQPHSTPKFLLLLLLLGGLIRHLKTWYFIEEAKHIKEERNFQNVNRTRIQQCLWMKFLCLEELA